MEKIRVLLPGLALSGSKLFIPAKIIAHPVSSIIFSAGVNSRLKAETGPLHHHILKWGIFNNEMGHTSVIQQQKSLQFCDHYSSLKLFV